MKYTDFYLHATSIPLLRGINAEYLLNMQERGWMKVVTTEPEEGDIIRQGEACCALTMLLCGELACISQGDGWTLQEQLRAPDTIEEEALWSLQHTFAHTYRPTQEGKLLVIPQETVKGHLLHNEIFRINLLVRMADRLGHRRQMALDLCRPAHTAEEKIMRFVNGVAFYRTGTKTLKTKMTTLAELVGETRLNVSKALHKLERQGTLRMERETFVFLHT